MKINLAFYAPQEGPFYRKHQAPAHRLPQLALGKNGRFTLNAATAQLLGLKPKDRVMLGNDSDNPRDWYLSVADTLGFACSKFGNSGALIFHSLPLRQLLLNTLPNAPREVTLTFKIDGHSLGTDDGEVWPLLTAAYFEKPLPPTATPAHRVLIAAPSGFLGIRKSAELYQSPQQQ